MDVEKKYLRDYMGYKVYLVDEYAIRDMSRPLQEFTNFGTSEQFPELIPADEIWVSDSYNDDEVSSYVDTAAIYKNMVRLGIPFGRAYNIAIGREKVLRERRRNAVGGCPWSTNEKPSRDDIYVEKMRDIDGVTVWIVDGDVLRDCFKTDFVEGGHGYVYPWIPNDEIWIEDEVDQPEREAILLHEYVELVKMRDDGWDYSEAHEEAGRREFEYRQQNRKAAMGQKVASELVKIAKNLLAGL
jgi:hypothetical protein